MIRVMPAVCFIIGLCVVATSACADLAAVKIYDGRLCAPVFHRLPSGLVMVAGSVADQPHFAYICTKDNWKTFKGDYCGLGNDRKEWDEPIGAGGWSAQETLQGGTMSVTVSTKDCLGVWWRNTNKSGFIQPAKLKRVYASSVYTRTIDQIVHGSHDGNVFWAAGEEWVGGEGHLPRLWVSTDRGETWDIVDLQQLQRESSFRIHDVSAQCDVWASSFRSLFRLDPGRQAHVFPMFAGATAVTALSAPDGRQVFAVYREDTGQKPKWVMMYSPDDGTTWQQLCFGYIEPKQIDFCDRSFGMMALDVPGAPGLGWMLWITRDGARTWEQESMQHYWVHDVDVVSPTEAYILATTIADRNTYVLRWSPSAVPPAQVGAYATAFVSQVGPPQTSRVDTVAMQTVDRPGMVAINPGVTGRPAPPELTWWGKGSFQTVGVKPTTGAPGSKGYQFRVIYRSADNTPAQYVNCEISGVAQVYPMQQTGLIGADYKDGAIYDVYVGSGAFRPGHNYLYRFTAHDRRNAAVGQPTLWDANRFFTTPR